MKSAVLKVRAMKIDRHDRAKILTTKESQRLFGEGFADNPYPVRDRALYRN